MTALEEEMIKATALFETTSQQLLETKESLAATAQSLAVTENTLQETQETLAVTAHAKAQTEFLLSAHVVGHDELHAQATTLLATAETATLHVEGLHGKIARKTAVEQHNQSAVGAFAEVRSASCSLKPAKKKKQVHARDTSRITCSLNGRGLQELSSKLEAFQSSEHAFAEQQSSRHEDLATQMTFFQASHEARSASLLGQLQNMQTGLSSQVSTAFPWFCCSIDL